MNVNGDDFGTEAIAPPATKGRLTNQQILMDTTEAVFAINSQTEIGSNGYHDRRWTVQFTA